MNSLPSELLHNIFIRVPLQQRLECMLVSRYWYNTLHTRSLLHDVEIKGDETYKHFINMLQTFPSRGSQVEFLKLTISCTADKRILCNILPNLRVFEFTYQLCRLRLADFCSQPFKLVDSHSKLEVIRDNFHCELTRQWLQFSSFLPLRCLELRLDRIRNPRTDIFILLKNAPTLKELQLRYCEFQIEDFEIIHNSLPVLETLICYATMLNAGELPRDIIPATSVRQLKIMSACVRDQVNYPEWYIYMAKKYTDLTSFDHQEHHLMTVDSNQATKIYREGIFPLYKNIGRHLNYFDAVNLSTELEAFKTLDAFGLCISKVNFVNNGTRPIFKQLVESNQSKHVESIKLESTAIASPIMLKHFTSLRKIQIDNEPDAFWNVNLTDYLNAFPITLTSFSASFLDAEVDELPSHPNHVQEFSLSCKTLSPTLAKVISTCFPKLTDLYLSGCVTKDLDIHLPDNDFQKIEINAYYTGEQSHGFSVTETSCDPRPTYYIQDPIAMYRLQIVSPKELQDRVTVTLKYMTASKCYLHALPINELDTSLY